MTLLNFIRGLRFTGQSQERANAQRLVWDALPDYAQNTRHQWLGQMTTGCSATHGIHEACDFACTACYLETTANKTPPLPLAEVKAQLDEIRAFTGPGGNTQITAGEVTLLPVEHLAEVVRHARKIGLDPMVMTHGQTFERDPAYLDRLMRAGLEKISIHVDETQRGRDNAPKKPTEHELFAVRDRMANVVRDARARTGLPLYASHTVTVTDRNIDAVPEIMRWAARNVDAFRMVSFQPTAAVGRTRSGRITEGELVWKRIQEGAGRKLNPHTFTLGDHECNRVCLSFVVRFGDEVKFIEVKREDKVIDAKFFDHLNTGRFREFYTDGASGADLIGRLIGLLLREPRYLLEWPTYGLYRSIAELPWVPHFLASVLRREPWCIRPFVTVVHHFMSSDQLDTEEGKRRLSACSFMVPVDGEMISMCELNGSGKRRTLNERQQQRLIPIERLHAN